MLALDCHNIQQVVFGINCYKNLQKWSPVFAGYTYIGRPLVSMTLNHKLLFLRFKVMR